MDTVQAPGRSLRAQQVAATLYLFFIVALTLLTSRAGASEQVATFAGGCFWCMEPPYDKVDGVISTTSGFMGGTLENPSYKEVSRGGTGHAEVVQVVFDDDRVEYSSLLEIYWRNVDPYDGGGQFCDRGPEYRPAIFYHSPEQREDAERSLKKLQDSGKLADPVAVDIDAATEFYPAEDYHQDYYQKNPARYAFYRWNCGRDDRLEEVWGSDE